MIVRVMFVLSLLLLQVIDVLAAEWKMDRKNSTLNFIASYEGVEAPGQFKQFDVHFQFDFRALSNNQLNVTVELAHADMGSDDINTAIVQKEWFHVAEFPRANFKSNKIVKKDENNFVAKGTLILKGIQKPLDVPFRWNEKGKSAVMQGELLVKRTNFNIGTGEWSAGNVIGIDVKVKFNVEFRRGK